MENLIIYAFFFLTNRIRNGRIHGEKNSNEEKPLREDSGKYESCEGTARPTRDARRSR